MNKFVDTLKRLLAKEFSAKRCVLCDNFLSEMIFLETCLCQECQSDLGAEKRCEALRKSNVINFLFMTEEKEKAQRLSLLLKRGCFEKLNRSVAAIYSKFIARNIKISKIDILAFHPHAFEGLLTYVSDFREEIVRTIGKNLGIIVHADLFKKKGNNYFVDMPEIIKHKHILMVDTVLDAPISREFLETAWKYDVAKLEIVALLGSLAEHI